MWNCVSGTLHRRRPGAHCVKESLDCAPRQLHRICKPRCITHTACPSTTSILKRRGKMIRSDRRKEQAVVNAARSEARGSVHRRCICAEVLQQDEMPICERILG